MNICVNSATQKCPNKIIKIFLIEDFSHLPPVSTTRVVNLELRISPRIFEKIRNGPNGILWGWGETDWWKNQKRKISWHCPFKIVVWAMLMLATGIRTQLHCQPDTPPDSLNISWYTHKAKDKVLLVCCHSFICLCYNNHTYSLYTRIVLHVKNRS